MLEMAMQKHGPAVWKYVEKHRQLCEVHFALLEV
jgi:hypothetical protein